MATDDKTQSDFFAEKSAEVETPEAETIDAPEKITVGEKEYNQEELNDLAGLGEKLKQFETNQGQSFDDYLTAMGNQGNEIAELKTKLGDVEKTQLDEKAQGGWDNMSQEERDKMSFNELDRLKIPYGDKLNEIIEEKLKARDFTEDVQDFIDEQVEAGKPKVSVQEVLREAGRIPEYSNANSYDKIDYEKVYRTMFPSQIEAWESQQLGEQKPQGFVTNETPSGANTPEPTKVTKDNLGDQIEKTLYG